MADENNAQSNGGAGESQEAPRGLQIKRIYLKDLSFETPMGAEAFGAARKPKIDQELNVRFDQIDETHYEVVLLLTVTARQDDRVVFLVEVQQAGLFGLQGLDKAQLGQVINTSCPQILFPYAREVIDSTLSRGSFPPVMLPPINFDAVFAQAVRQKGEQQSTQQSPDTDA